MFKVVINELHIGSAINELFWMNFQKFRSFRIKLTSFSRVRFWRFFKLTGKSTAIFMSSLLQISRRNEFTISLLLILRRKAQPQTRSGVQTQDSRLCPVESVQRTKSEQRWTTELFHSGQRSESEMLFLCPRGKFLSSTGDSTGLVQY